MLDVSRAVVEVSGTAGPSQRRTIPIRSTIVPALTVWKTDDCAAEFVPQNPKNICGFRVPLSGIILANRRLKPTSPTNPVY